jgi:phosphoribosylformimino-5-aminoimidazole carboxamide ribotide isomerase
MLVIPAVDIRAGRCVRLRTGRMDQETVFDEDPVAAARRWARAGARRLHVVDLDGAFAGAPRQPEIVARVAAAVAPVPVQVGGGLRHLAAVRAALAAGARWAVVGTRAALDDGFLRAVCRAYPDRIIVAADSREGRVAVRGWTEVVAEPTEAFARRAAGAGAAAVLYTDVSRDGTGSGPNVEEATRLAACGLPVIVSGGVATLDDVRRLAAVPGVLGVVVGWALYAGRLDLGEAQAVADRLSHQPPGPAVRGADADRPVEA